MKEIPLTQGKVALVDDEDYDVLIQWKWHRLKGRGTFYAARHSPRVGGKRHPILMHRFLMSPEDGMQVDHIDHNGLNNQRSNLRIVTHSQNQRNQKPQSGCSSRYKGVSWCARTKKWQAFIRYGNRNRHMGRFSSETEAALAYDQAARKFFGEYAYLNFPGGVVICE